MGEGRVRVSLGRHELRQVPELVERGLLLYNILN